MSEPRGRMGASMAPAGLTRQWLTEGGKVRLTEGGA